MNPFQQEQKAKEYLAKWDLLHVFEDLLTALIVYQPETPIHFLSEILLQLKEQGGGQPEIFSTLPRAKNLQKPPRGSTPQRKGVPRQREAQGEESDEEPTNKVVPPLVGRQELHGEPDQSVLLDEKFVARAREVLNEEKKLKSRKKSVQSPRIAPPRRVPRVAMRKVEANPVQRGPDTGRSMVSGDESGDEADSADESELLAYSNDMQSVGGVGVKKRKEILSRKALKTAGAPVVRSSHPSKVNVPPLRPFTTPGRLTQKKERNDREADDTARSMMSDLSD